VIGGIAPETGQLPETTAFGQWAVARSLPDDIAALQAALNAERAARQQAGDLLPVVRYEKAGEHSLDLTMTLGAAAKAGVPLIVRSAAQGPKVRRLFAGGRRIRTVGPPRDNDLAPDHFT
jgi:hypothetical protein